MQGPQREPACVSAQDPGASAIATSVPHAPMRMSTSSLKAAATEQRARDRWPLALQCHTPRQHDLHTKSGTACTEATSHYTACLTASQHAVLQTIFLKEPHPHYQICCAMPGLTMADVKCAPGSCHQRALRVAPCMEAHSVSWGPCRVPSNGGMLGPLLAELV